MTRKIACQLNLRRLLHTLTLKYNNIHTFFRPKPFTTSTYCHVKICVSEPVGHVLKVFSARYYYLIHIYSIALFKIYFLLFTLI